MRYHDNLEQGLTMNLEIRRPELVRRVNAHIQTGHFQDADELIERALDALEGKAAAPPASFG
jgi:Arc/MetJ-type ribon-helix-helix transcriptional regulator